MCDACDFVDGKFDPAFYGLAWHIAAVWLVEDDGEAGEVARFGREGRGQAREWRSGSSAGRSEVVILSCRHGLDVEPFATTADSRAVARTLRIERLAQAQSPLAQVGECAAWRSQRHRRLHHQGQIQ